MLNNITLMGRLTRAPELRATQTGKSVASFTIAVDRDYDRSTTDFVNCVAWGGTAEFVDRNFTKGQMMALSGRLQMREWTDKNGNNRIAAEVVADHVYFCGDKKATNKGFTDIDPADDEFGDGVLPF